MRQRARSLIIRPVGLALMLAGLSLPASAQQTDGQETGPASDTTAAVAPAPAADTTGSALPALAPAAAAPESVTLAELEVQVRPASLPPISTRSFGVTAPPLPPAQPGDTIIVPQMNITHIRDPEVAARADSLNRVLRMVAIEERLLRSDVQGRTPRVGILTRKEYLEARVDLLRTMEQSLRTRLQEKLTALDTAITTLDSTIEATRTREITEIEDFLARYPSSRYVADAKFILGQLYYSREQQRNNEALQRYLTELRRWGMGLIPVAPRQPTMNEAIAVPLYRAVVALGTNQQLLPYSLYSLGKYHLEAAKDHNAQKGLARLSGNREEGNRQERLEQIEADSAKQYFARLVTDFPGDSVNVPEAYFVLASHYNVLGGIANRDTAATYALALIRNYWYSPRYQNMLMMLAEINFYNGVLTSLRDRALSNRYYADALAYLAWAAREIDAFEAEQIAGVSPEEPPMLGVGRRDRTIQFMTQIITRRSPPGVGTPPPPPVDTAIRLVSAAGNPPFGADLLRQVGDSKNQEYQVTSEPQDLVAALTAYDSLLSRYPTYEEGPQIQQTIIDNATYLSQDPNERVRIYINQKISFFERFSRNGAWAANETVPANVRRAADDSSASYLEQAAKYLYVQARNAGDRDGIRRSLDYFVEYFQTYPERPQAYELNWSVATELRDLGDYNRAYDEFMRITRAPLVKYREDAAVEAVAAAQQLVEAEQQGQAAPPAPSPTPSPTPSPR